MELNLNRPLLFFDIESTGLSIPTDSIIELSFVKVFPGGESRIKTWKIKPWDYVNKCQKPINPEASKVNGVTDDMLTGCPRFFEVVEEVVDWLKDSDLAGFNSAKFDLPMLAEEIERVRKFVFPNINIDLHEPVMVDVQNIYHAMEPRNLKAAYRFYCGGGDFENAHTAEADTLATYEVLKGQLDRYSEPDAYHETALRNDVDFLANLGGRPKGIDYAGRIVDRDGVPTISFGKYKDRPVKEVYRSDKGYFGWIANGDFSLDTKRQFRRLFDEYAAEEKASRSKPLEGKELSDAADLLKSHFGQQ